MTKLYFKKLRLRLLYVFLCLIFSGASKFPKPSGPPRPIPQRGLAPIPPQGAIKTADTMGGGDNPAQTGAAPQANLNNSTSTNHSTTGNVVFRTVSFEALDPMASDVASAFPFTDPDQMLADFGFYENFNNALQVEEKKNQQNRFVASREPPPVPTLPPRKASFPPTTPLPPTPIQKDKTASVQAKSSSAVMNTKPE